MRKKNTRTKEEIKHEQNQSIYIYCLCFGNICLRGDFHYD